MDTEQSELNYEDVWKAYDPSKRATNKEIDESIRALAEHPVVSAILDAANVEMVVVNPELQIVAANRTIVEKIGAKDITSIIGKRLGEAIFCINTNDENNCCGSNEECAGCGATRCVLSSIQTGTLVAGECVIEGRDGGKQSVAEYSVRATPVTINNLDFTVVAMQDISDSKRRRALEGVFMHDLNNTLTGLIGWSEDLSEHSAGETAEAASNIESLARRLALEVDYHRILSAVEAEKFNPRFQTTYPVEVLENIEVIFSRYAHLREQSLEKVEPVANTPCITDRALLERVLVNMVKNAFEATDSSKPVKIGCSDQGGSVRFFVWNEGAIPLETRGRVFERSFTTKKETGRGLGTYSMKLFGEVVLGGRVWFETTRASGTTFFFELPYSKESS